MTEATKICASILSRSRYDGIIFDLDGVITRTAKLHAVAWKETFDSYLKARSGGADFKPFSIEEDYRNYVDGKPRYEGVKSFLESRDIDIPYGTPDDPPDLDTVCGLGNSKNELFISKLKTEGADVYQSSVDLINNLRQRGYRIAVASSSKNCAVVLDASHLTSLFDAKVDGVDVESLDLKGKPDPDMFLEAARRLGLEPHRCIVVEDAISGVEAGVKGGFGLVVGVNRLDQAEALKEAGADLVVDDLSEIDIEVVIADLPNALVSLREIEERIADRKVAVFLDYDGTLTPIVSRPEDAVLSKDMRGKLMALSSLCPVAIVSGRGLEDVKGLVSIENIYYAGSHGFEIGGPNGFSREYDEVVEFLPELDEVEASLRERLQGVEGAQVERKKFTVAVHYRNVRDEDAGLVEEALNKVHAEHAGFRRTEGKKVYELQPDLEWDKGKAVQWLRGIFDLSLPMLIPFYIGDDITDEDAFEALRGHGISVVVGEGSRCTSAQYSLASTEEVGEFLEYLTDLLDEQSTWCLVDEEYDPSEEGLREALCTLGNGYFATRGASPESEADGVHYPGTYLAGGYNRLKTEVDGRVVENEDLVNMPNWLCLDFRIDGEAWFKIDKVDILAYRQELEIRKGVLHRSILFRDDKGRETNVFCRRIVSMASMHMAAMEMIIVPINWSGMIEIRSALDGRVTNSGVARYKGLNNKHLEPVQTRQVDNNTILLEVSTNQSKIGVAQAARTLIFRENELETIERTLVEEPGYIAQHMSFEVAERSRIMIEKTMALYTSRDYAISEWTLEAEKSAVDAENFEGILADHVLAWSHIWRRFEVVLKMHSIPEQRYVHRILRLYRFHLLQTACMNSLDVDLGMPSRGWHGEAYRGHVFWDELIIFPFLNYRIPEVTRALLMYRYRRMGEARKAARKLGYKGAMFPWQSGSNGREETQELHLNPKSGNWIADNSHLQRHINAAIVYNIWQYYQVTADLEFLSWYGAEMIIEIARFWASITRHNPFIDRYEIKGIMGPDEYHDAYPDALHPGLDNNAYTNIMVVYVMNRALELFDLMNEERMKELCGQLEVEDSEIARWKDIAKKMRVVFHEDGIISQFEGYEDLEEFDWVGYHDRYGNIQRLDRILEAEGDTTNRYKVSKQADVLMLFYLFSSEQLTSMIRQLGYDFNPTTIPTNIDYYLKRTCNGSSLSWIIHSWVDARRDRKRSWELFNVALLTDFADVQGGTTAEGIHLGAMAGCVDMMGRGYTGLECRVDKLRLNPDFPEELLGLHMHLRYRGQWLELDMNTERVRVEALSGVATPINLEVDGREFEIKEGQTIEIPLR